MSYQAQEMIEIERLTNKYRKDGFETADDVNLPKLPVPFASYRPDLVLRRNDEFLAIEIKSRKVPAVHSRLLDIKKAFEDHPKWKFVISYISEDDSLKGPAVQSKREILHALAQVKSLSRRSEFRAAFLLSWASFEAAARRLHSQIFSKPQSPGRLATVLAERGILDVDEVTAVRVLLAKRNNLIHGGLGTHIEAKEIDAMIRIIEKTISAK